MKDIAALIRRNPVECACIAFVLVAAYAGGGVWAWQEVVL